MTGTAALRYVDATLGGQALRMALSPEPRATASLETAVGGAFACFERFRAGAWTGRDVRLVLAHAVPGTPLMHGFTRAEVVEAAIAAQPAAVYAPLAVKLLQAFLFGLPAGEAAFDEGREA